MYKKAKLPLLGVFVLLASLNLTAATAAAPPQDAYDAAAYTAYVEETMQKLNKLYLTSIDENVPQGEVEKAKKEYLKVARDLLKTMNEKFDGMKVKQGAALSDTEVLLSIHVMTMMLDMLASEHQPHRDKWDYVH